MNYSAAWLILLLYLAFAFQPFQDLIRGLIKKIGDWTVGFLLIPYLLATNFQPIWGEFVRIIIFLAIPTLLLHIRPKNAKPFDLFQVLAMLAIWFPIEPSLFLLLLDVITFGKILPPQAINMLFLPEVDATFIPGFSLPIPTLIAVCLALYLFFIRYPLDGIVFSFKITRKDLINASLGLTFYSLVGLPIGLGLGFLQFNPTRPSLLELMGSILAGYLFVALIEEILFRGVIQNLITERLRNRNVALIIASVIFGFAHLNNATQGFPVPNWSYVIMATLAGLAYGWVWRRSGKV